MKSHCIKVLSLFAAVGVLGAYGLMTTGCETTKGVGRDIEDTGAALEGAVEGEDAEGTRRNPR